MKLCVGWVTSVATTEAMSSGCSFFFGSLPDAAPLAGVVVEVGIDGAGSDDADADDQLAQLFGDRIGEAIQAPFRCSVGGAFRKRIAAGERGDVDDVAGTRGDHERREGANHQVGPAQVGVEDEVPLVRSYFGGAYHRVRLAALLTRMSQRLCPWATASPNWATAEAFVRSQGKTDAAPPTSTICSLHLVQLSAGRERRAKPTLPWRRGDAQWLRRLHGRRQ